MSRFRTIAILWMLLFSAAARAWAGGPGWQAAMERAAYGCFTMEVYLVNKAGEKVKADEYSARLYMNDSVKYGRYEFATVLIRDGIYLKINHIEKEVFLTDLEADKPKPKKARPLKVDGIEIVPAQYEYKIVDSTVQKDGSRSYTLSFENGYSYYDRAIISLLPDGRILSTEYIYVSNPDWEKSILEYQPCAVLPDKRVLEISSYVVRDQNDAWQLTGLLEGYTLTVNYNSTHPKKRKR